MLDSAAAAPCEPIVYRQVALLKAAKRAATLRALEHSGLIVVSKADFNSIMDGGGFQVHHVAGVAFVVNILGLATRLADAAC